ncbi:MAG: CapA family protein [Acidobacteria bacterium]|nr:CapA family protein [Acidobacteriota bacterium]
MKLTPFDRSVLVSVFIAALSGCSLLSKNSMGTPPQPPEDKTEHRATFIAVGDIMLSRGINAAIMSAGDPNVVFRNTGEEFAKSDFNFANLESPVSGDDSRIGKGLVFNARKANIPPLLKNKFSIITVANNHSMDQGLKGLQFTRSYLDQIGIKHTGTGDNKDEAWKGEFVEINGIKIGFIGVSYASVNDGGVLRNDYVARIEDTDYLQRSIADLRKQGCDFVFVAVHAGIEYTRRPEPHQVTFAHAAIDAGADAVIGAHPHWIQTAEKYKDKYIFYSLGNFIFDQPWPDTREGLTLKISLYKRGNEKRIDSIELKPVMIENRSTPRWANSTEAATILKKIDITDPILK